MLIKSNVLQKKHENKVEDSGSGNAALKSEILEECRHLIIEMMRKEKER